MDPRKGGTGGEGSDQKSTENVSQNQRLAKHFSYSAAHNGGAEHVREVPKEGGFHVVDELVNLSV